MTVLFHMYFRFLQGCNFASILYHVFLAGLLDIRASNTQWLVHTQLTDWSSMGTSLWSVSSAVVPKCGR